MKTGKFIYELSKNCIKLRLKEVCCLVMFLLFASVFSVAVSADVNDNFNSDKYVYWVSGQVKKSTYSSNESIQVAGTLKRANLSNTKAPNVTVNITDYYLVGENFSVNISIMNETNTTFGIVSQMLVNTTGGTFKTKGDNYPNASALYAPLTEGDFKVRFQYYDSGNDTGSHNNINVRVTSKTIDKVFVFPDKSRYSGNETVTITASVWTQSADSLVPVSNVTLNGTVRRSHGNNDQYLSSFSCTTNDQGSCTINVAAPSKPGRFIIEVNNFLASSGFHVVPFDVAVYIKDSTGTSFKDILSTNEQASVEVKVTKNGSTPTGSYVFNGSITDSGGSVVVNITSTKLNDTNSFINRFGFTVGNTFTDGIYKANVDVFETDGTNVTSSAFFQVRSWTMYMTKASDNSGFAYEYSAFPDRNITFEVYPKERANGSLIATLNNTHFNVTLVNSQRQILSSTNITFNGTCGTQGCYKFSLVTPGVVGSYIVAVTLNFSDVVQTAERTVKVTDLTASAYPSTFDGSLKELFSTTEFVYLSISGRNISSDLNISNATIGQIIFENGTEMNYTRVANWADVNDTNSVHEWAFNGSVDRIMLDVPKQGGAYSVKLFINNNSASASTSFIVNPYDSCSSAKSAAGTIDSSSSWYVWQYKSTDTVYIELKLSRAENPAGRAAAENSTAFNQNQYGMGYACIVDTTKKQVIANATIVVEKVVNAVSGARQSLNTTATVCSADNDNGQYTCTIKPTSKWDGGRSMVHFKITGPDQVTTDRATTIFEARSFYMWAYADNYAWVQKPSSNITFNVRIYEAGSNWWSNWYSNSQSGGISGSVSVEKVNYMGDYGEWIWPPIDYKYNTTGLNSSNISNGWGKFTIYHDRTPKSKWQSGTYSVTMKGTNDANGETDFGDAWFSVRQWEAYSTPIESGSYNYKDSYSPKENISLYVRLYPAGSWNDNGGTALGGNVTVSVKKLQLYQAGGYKEVNSSLYSVVKINVNTSSPWYWNANAAYRGHIMNITRVQGSWDGGWYSATLDINGTETGYGYFNVIPFNINTQPVNASGSYTYTSRGSGPVYFNISTTKNKKNQYSWYSTGDYINTTITDLTLRTWKSDTWETVQLNYPEDLNISPLTVNGTAIVQVNKSGTWASGYYSGEVSMKDADGSTATGYIWFSVQSFRVSASTLRYTVDIDGNASFNLNVYQPDWANNNLVYGNYTVSRVSETLWSGSGYSVALYENYRPSASQTFNATTQLNVTPNRDAWSLANGGYRYLQIKVVDNSDNSSQTAWASFRVLSVAVSVGSITNQYSISKTQNITIPVTVTKSSTGGGTLGNLTRVYEWGWPYVIEHNFTVGTCKSWVTGTCMINSTPAGGSNGTSAQNVNVVVPSGSWSEGSHSLNLEFTTATDKSQKIDSGYAWFTVTTPYVAYWYNEDINASYKYYFSDSENITFRMQLMNSTYQCGGARVNVSKVEVSYSGSSCWSDYCRKYNAYSFVIVNQTASWITAPTVGGNEINCSERRLIRILHNGTNWEKGSYYIRVTINGSQGEATMKTGYFGVKDTNAPNATLQTPVFNSTVNGSLYVNVTTSETANCYVYLMNYDQFASYYCYDQKSTNGTVDTMTVDYRACNSANFNGTQYYYAYASKWYTDGGQPGYSFNTDSLQTTFNFSISKLPKTQDYAINIWCYDSDWNYVQRRTAFRVNVSNDSSVVVDTSVNVSLKHPNDGQAVSQNNINLSVNINHSTGLSVSPLKVANCTLYTNFTGNWTTNRTVINFIAFNHSTTKEEGAFELNHATEGTYKWGVACNITNTSGTQWSSTNRTFTVSLSSSSASNELIINLSTPNSSFTNSSGTVYAHLYYNVSINTVVNLNCTLFSNFTGMWGDTSSQQYLGNITNVVNTKTNNYFMWNITTNGSYLYGVKCTNTTLTNYSDNRTITVTVSNGSTTNTSASVNITLLTPADTISITNGLLTHFNFTANHTYGANYNPHFNCSLYTNFSGSWAVNQTRHNLIVLDSSSMTEDNGFNITHSTGGTYNWGVLCNATNSTPVWARTNRTVTFVASILNITLLGPADNMVQNRSNITFSFNWSGTRTTSSSCSLFANFTGSWLLNVSADNLTSTSSGAFNNHTFSLNHSTNGVYKWSVNCTNISSATVNAWALSNYTFRLENMT